MGLMGGTPMPLWPDAIRRLRVPGSGHSGEGRISWRAGQRRVAGKIGTLTIFDRDANFNDLIDDPGATGVVTYSYDPASPERLRRAGGFNRRIRKVLAVPNPDITYDYYYNESWQVLEVRKGGDTDPLEQYVWGVQYVDAPVVRFRDGNVDGDLLDTQDNTDSTLHYTYDGNFNVTAVIKPDGTVAERYTYDPYGKVTFKAADWSDAASQAKSAYDNEILYCGYRFDPESGLYHVRYRYYHPTLGRWLTTDPIQYGDGMNRYQYVGGMPATQLDPNGLTASDWVTKVWGGAVPKAIGVGAGALIQYKIWALPGLQAGAQTAVIFFPDTCQVAAFSTATGIAKVARDDILPALVAGQAPQVTWATAAAAGGEPFEGGKQLGASVAIEAAFMIGPSPASPSSFEGDFYTIQGSIQAGTLPVSVAGSGYAGVKDSLGRQWYGGTLGVGTPGVSGGSVVWNYKKMGEVEVPWCLCLALIYAMP
jgi:RHS repeat-associated protein